MFDMTSTKNESTQTTHDLEFIYLQDHSKCNWFQICLICHFLIATEVDRVRMACNYLWIFLVVTIDGFYLVRYFWHICIDIVIVIPQCPNKKSCPILVSVYYPKISMTVSVFATTWQCFFTQKKATNHRELKAWRDSMVHSIVFCNEHVIAILSLCHCFYNIFADSRCNRGSIRNCLLQVLHQCLCWLCGYELRERLCSVHRDTDRGGAGSVPSYLQSTDSRRSQASLLQRSCQTCYQNLQAAGESMRSLRFLYW